MALTSNLAKNLLAQAQTPIKSFQIVKKTKTLDGTNNSVNTNTIDYVFEQNDNSINTLSTYITKSNINLLFIDRMGESSKNKSNFTKLNIKDISKLNVSILLEGKEGNI